MTRNVDRSADVTSGHRRISARRSPLFRRGLLTLQPICLDFEFGGDLLHGIIFPLVLATHYSGAGTRL